MTEDRISRVLPVVSVAFAIAYVLATEFNWALLTYHPATGEWGFGAEAAKAPRQPAMYWYGWLLTAAVVAIASGAAALASPTPLAKRVSPHVIWAVPVTCMVFILYLLRGYFLR